MKNFFIDMWAIINIIIIIPLTIMAVLINFVNDFIIEISCDYADYIIELLKNEDK